MAALRRARSTLLILAAVLAGIALATPTAMARSRAPVRSVGPLPAAIHGGQRLALKVAAASKPSFFLSRDTRRGRGDLRLSARVRLRGGHGTATLKLPRKLAPGVWFVLACPARGNTCAVSKPGLVRAAKHAAPQAASIALASGNAASATIGTVGGNLSARGPDGTRYLLSIPAGSVPDGTTITMTPLQDLTGPAFAGKFAAGVQFAPEGLVLLHGGTLTIQLAHQVPKARQVALGFGAGGSDLHIVPIVPSKTKLMIPLGHFSGAAVGNSGSAATGSPGTSDNTGFYGGLLGQLVADWRDGSMSDSEFESAAVSALKDWYQDISSQEIPPGLNDDGAAETAIQDLLLWARTGALLIGEGHTCSGGDAGHFCTYDGMSKVFGPDWEEKLVATPLQKLLGGIYDRAQQRCADKHDFTQIPRIVSDYRNLVLAGHPDDVSPDELYACDHFTVDFDSTIVTQFGGQDVTGSDTNEYEAKVPIKPDLSHQSLTLTGSAPGTYIQASGQEVLHNQDCGQGSGGSYEQFTDETGGTGAMFMVTNFTPPTGTTEPQLNLVTGAPTEQYRVHIDTTDCASSQTMSLPLWAGDFAQLHLGQLDTSAGSGAGVGFRLPLQPESGAVIASAEYDPTLAVGDDTLSEHTVITVTHTPASFRRL